MNLKIINWVAKTFIFAIFRSIFIFTTYIPNKILRLIGMSNKKIIDDSIVFVEGFFSFTNTDVAFIDYWGVLGNRLLWIPKIGPFSSNSDRACELLYGLFSSIVGGNIIKYKHDDPQFNNFHNDEKPLYDKKKLWIQFINYISYIFQDHIPGNIKKPIVFEEENDKYNNLNLVSHSSGGNTINCLLRLLLINHINLIKMNLLSLDTLPKEININDITENFIFTKNDGSPLLVTPRSINKIVYISTPQGGVEFMRQATNTDINSYFVKNGVGYYVAKFIMFYQKIFLNISFLSFDTYLSQFTNPEKYEEGIHTIAYDFIQPNTKKMTDKAIEVINAYNIKTLRVITRASSEYEYNNETINLLNPGRSVVLLPFVGFGAGWKFDYNITPENKRDGYTNDRTENDGLVSVTSQLYGAKKCLCMKNIIPKGFYKCHCGLLYIDNDHLEVVGTFETLSSTDKLYTEIFEWIKSS